MALTVAVGMATGAFAPLWGSASSHREAPIVAGDPEVDTTDVYAFVSPNKPDTVTIVGSWFPFEEPAGGPNFYQFEDGAHYEFNIDNDGDAKEDIIYRWVFQTHVRNEETFLYANGPVTSLKSDVDVVVTEWGVADLRAASLEERAQRLRAVAAPGHRDVLAAS